MKLRQDGRVCIKGLVGFTAEWDEVALPLYHYSNSAFTRIDPNITKKNIHNRHIKTTLGLWCTQSSLPFSDKDKKLRLKTKKKVRIGFSCPRTFFRVFCEYTVEEVQEYLKTVEVDILHLDRLESIVISPSKFYLEEVYYDR